MYKKEIQRVEVSLNEKKYKYIFIFLLETNSRRCFLYFFFKFYSKFPFDSYIIIYFRIQKKKAQIIRMDIIFFLLPNSTFLHISFPRRQMTKARNFNFFFFIGKLIKFLIHWYVAYLRMGKYSPKTYKIYSVNNEIIASAVNVNLFFFFIRQLPYLYIDFLEFFFFFLPSVYAERQCLCRVCVSVCPCVHSGCNF